MIEVTIFLAITALMVAIAVMGTGSRIASTRFTDAVRSFESFVQRQYDETLNGVNTRTGAEACPTDSADSQPGQSQNCLLLGKHLHFAIGSSKVKVSTVVGTVTNGYAPSDGDLVAIRESQPRIVDAASEEYDIPWQALVHGTRQDNGTSAGQRIDSIAFLRSPKSSSIYVYTFHKGASADDLTPFVEPSAGNSGKQVNICIRSQDNFPVYGAITLAASGRGQDTIGSRIDIGSNDLSSTCEGVL